MFTKIIKKFLIGVSALIVGFLLVVFFTFDIVRVGATEVSVVTNRGKVTQVLGAGWHPKTPLLTRHVATYDISTISNTITAAAASSDQQSVTIEVNIQYRLKSHKIKDLYLKVGGGGNKYDQKIDAIVDPILNESTKSASAQFTATEILSKRDQLKSLVEKNLQPKLDEYFIDVITINIANVEFSKQFKQAIENKVTAQQKAEQLKFELEGEKANLEKEKVKAEALQVRGEALKANPEVLEEKKIQKWNGELPKVQGSEGVIIDLD